MTTQYSPAWNNVSRTQTCIRANVADSGSAANSTLLDLQVNNVSKFTVDKFGELILTPTARTSGSDSLLNLIAPADTTRAAGVEATDINFNLARTVQFAAGNIATQRAIRIQAPTYSFVSASTITNASTLSISGAPVAGTNATITNRWGLLIENNGIKLAFPSASTATLGNSRPSSSQWMYLVNTTNVVNRPIGIVFGGYDDFHHMAIQSVMTHAGGNTFGKLSFVEQGGSEWLRVSTDIYTAGAQIGVSVAEAMHFGALATNIAADTSLVRESAGILAFRRSTTSHGFRLYNTFTDASNYERLALQFGTFSSARYAQIAAESAGTGAANINLVLTPRGTGALIAGPPPDGTTVGGNARGNGAVDLQTKRTAATQVASAPNCIIAGISNTCSGPYGGSAVFGDSCVSTSANNLVTGSGCSVTGYSAIALGAYSVCSANEGAAAIGRQVNVSGTYGFGANLQTEVPGVAGAAFGDNSRARLWGEFAHASGRFSTNGDCQRTAIILRGKTTTNTPVELVDPTRFIIPSGFIFHGILKISGSKSDGTSIAIYMRKVAIKRVGNTTTLLQVETIGTDYEDNINTNVTITADDVNEALKIEATGITGETWRWQSVIEGGLYAYGT